MTRTQSAWACFVATAGLLASVPALASELPAPTVRRVADVPTQAPSAPAAKPRPRIVVAAPAARPTAAFAVRTQPPRRSMPRPPARRVVLIARRPAPTAQARKAPRPAARSTPQVAPTPKTSCAERVVLIAGGECLDGT